MDECSLKNRCKSSSTFRLNFSSNSSVSLLCFVEKVNQKLKEEIQYINEKKYE